MTTASAGALARRRRLNLVSNVKTLLKITLEFYKKDLTFLLR